jgi:hypothetical protein
MMLSWRQSTWFGCLALLAACQGAAQAQSVMLTPSKDNTLIQWSPDTPGTNPLLSNALGDIFVGRTNQDGQEAATISIRRGLVQFNLTGAIPSGVTITSATLTMRDVMGRNGDPTVSLHRVFKDWGEGSSFFNGGQGAPVTDGDVTWLNTFYNANDPAQSPTWTTPGGDFSDVTSASAIISDDLGGGQLFSWSGPGMVADVQYWLDHSSQNFGWELIGDESRGQSAKRLDSRESTTAPNVPPMLTIQFAAILPGDYNNDGVVNAADYTTWRDQLGAPIALPNETATPGIVTSDDYEVWKAHFGAIRTGSAAQAQEPAPEPCGATHVLVAAIVAVGRAVYRWTADRERET